MDKGDIEFAIGIGFAILGFFGIEYKHIKGWLSKPKSGDATMATATPHSKRELLFVALIFAGLISSSLGWYRYDHAMNNMSHAEWNDFISSKLETIRGQTFKNREFDLDGKDVRDCNFENVTFVFHGKKPFVWEHNDVEGKVIAKVVDGPQANGMAWGWQLSRTCSLFTHLSCEIILVDENLKLIPNPLNQPPSP